MSNRILTWVWSQDIGDHGAKLVLIKLADQANDDGLCWPSQTTLASDCEMCERTIRRKIELLVAVGFVAVEKRPAGGKRWGTNQYRLGPSGGQSDHRTLMSTGHLCPPDIYDTDHRTLVSDKPSLEPIEVSSIEETSSGGRSRDEIWDALADLFGFAPAPKTNAHGKRNKAVGDLRKHGATRELILRAADAYSRLYGGEKLTDVALATHYPALVTEMRAQTKKATTPENAEAWVRKIGWQHSPDDLLELLHNWGQGESDRLGDDDVARLQLVAGELRAPGVAA